MPYPTSSAGSSFRPGARHTEPPRLRVVHTSTSGRIPRLESRQVRRQLLTLDARVVADESGLSVNDAENLQQLAAAIELRAMNPSTELQDGREEPGGAVSAELELTAEAEGDSGLLHALKLEAALALPCSSAPGAVGDEAERRSATLSDAIDRMLGTAPVLATAAQLAEKSRALRTYTELDRHVFRGEGLPPGMLIELVGDAGTGKTAVVLQFVSVAAALEDAPVTILWTTPAPFPLVTLASMIEAALLFRHGAAAASSLGPLARAALDRVTVVRSITSLPTWEAFADHVDAHLQRSGCRLLLVDSLTALVGSTSYAACEAPAAKRSADLLALTNRLKRIAAERVLPILVTNSSRSTGPQSRDSSFGALGAPDAITSDAAGPSFTSFLDSRGLFGVALHHAVNVRCVLERPPAPYAGVLHVVKSPGCSSMSFSMLSAASAASDRHSSQSERTAPALPITFERCTRAAVTALNTTVQKSTEFAIAGSSLAGTWLDPTPVLAARLRPT